MISETATLHAATCFLNSLFREWREIEIVDAEDAKASVIVPMLDGSHFEIPLHRFSALGRHKYVGRYYKVRLNSKTEVDFKTLVEDLCRHLGQRFGTQANDVDKFVARVMASRDIVSRSIEARKASLQESEKAPIDFRQAEQALLIGHNFHPTPKSRDEFSDNDLALYSPEFGGSFKVAWFLAAPQILETRSASQFPEKNWCENLATEEGLDLTSVKGDLAQGYKVFPMHPWQFERIKTNTAIQKYLKEGLLRPLTAGRNDWYATSSVRSVYSEHASYMLKFSMSVKLTNSVRHLLPKEVERGLQLFDVLETIDGKRFRSEHPNFHVIREPAFICLIDEEGRVLDETIAVCRENPFKGESARDKMVLATLAQDAIFGGANFAHSNLKLNSEMQARELFAQYLEIAFKPLILAHANYGIILCAHQQNLIFDIESGRLNKAYFRDCQGTGYSELGFETFAAEVPCIYRDNGNVVSEAMGRSLFVYYLVLNSTLNWISALCDTDKVTESRLLSDLRVFLTKLSRSELKDRSVIDFLLVSETLQHKGNFICSFRHINENTSDNPLSIYTEVENPIQPTSLACRGLSESWTETNGRKHPVRPPHPKIFFERTFVEIGKRVSFRRIEIERDLDLFHAWHNQARVYDLWDLNKSKEELKAYLEAGLSDPHQIPLIMEFDSRPVGYFEVYWAAEDRLAPYYDYGPYDRGFHFLIGEASYLGSANTGVAIRAVMQAIFADEPRTQRIVAEPRADNRKVLKYVQLIPGWRFIKEFDFPHKRAALLMANREDFISEGGDR